MVSLVYVDRVSGRTAVIVDRDGADYEIPAGWLPAQAREGKWLRVEVEGAGETRVLRFEIDAHATAAAGQQAHEQLARLRRSDRGDDDLP